MAGGVVARAVQRRYGKHGPRGQVRAALFMAIAIGVIGSFVTMSWLARYLRLPAADAALMFAVGGGCLAIGVPGLVVSYGRQLRIVRSWGGTERSAALAQAVWDAAVGFPYLVVRRAIAVGIVLIVPFTASVVLAFDQPAASALPIFVVPLSFILAGAALGAFVIELTFRPMLEDVASFLHGAAVPRLHGWRLRSKAVVPLPAVAFIAALSAGAFVDLVDPGPWRLALAEAVALVTTAVASVTFLIIMRSLLDPLDSLLDATRRVRVGDLSVRVPVVTDDDVGVLSGSFNEMLAALAESRDELRQSRARVVATADESRRRVERDLHDGAQQRLVLMQLRLGQLARRAEDQPELLSLVEGLRDELGAALAELRELAHGIYPAVLVSDGLGAALREACERSTIATEIDVDGVGRHPAEVEAAIYFCCLEALQNAAKHAGEGAHACVSLREQDRVLRFEVTDDGAGFDPQAVSGNAGLVNMADRIGALGGDLRIESRPGHGTRVRGSVPVACGQLVARRYASTASTRR